MTMNYERLGRPYKDGKWAEGIAVMNSTAKSLQEQGLLPDKFPQATEELEALALPEGAKYLCNIQTTGMNNDEIEKLAESAEELGLHISGWARDVIRNAPTTLLKEPQDSILVSMDARTMGIRDKYPTTRQIRKKGKELTGETDTEKMVKLAEEAIKGNVQVEIGKHLVGNMEPVTDSDGDPVVLYIARREDGLWLDASYAYPDNEWHPDHQFVTSYPVSS